MKTRKKFAMWRSGNQATWQGFAAWLLAAGLAAGLALSLPAPVWLQIMVAVAGSMVLPVASSLQSSRQQHQASREMVEAILDAIPQPVFVKAPDGRYLFVNQALARDHQCDRQEAISQARNMANADNERVSMVRAEDMAALAGQIISKEEHIIHPISGLEIDRLVTKSRCMDSDGNPAIVVTYFDLTALRNAERSARESLQREADLRQRTQAFTQRLIDVIPAPVYVKDEHSTYVMVNESFARERGRPKEEIIRHSSVERAINAQVSEAVLAEDARVLAGEPVYKEEHREYPDGSEKYRIISKGSCLGVDGRPVLVGANFDITALRQAELELRDLLTQANDSRQRTWEFMQRLLDIIPISIYVKDAQSRYLIVNKTLIAERHVTAESLIGKAPDEIDHDPAWVRRVLDEDAAILAGETVYKEECRPHRVTGEDRYRIIAKGLCEDAGGQPVIVVANIDVTDLRVAEKQAQQARQISDEANRAKSLFLASMSHEIRTPISGVIGTLRLAMRERSLTGNAQDLVSTALSNAQALLGIINDILDFSKIEAGELTLEKIDFDLRSIIRHSMSAFRDHLADRSLQFVIDIDPTLPAYYTGDPTRLRQVLINLVGNAIKFTREGQIALRAVKIRGNGVDEICQVRFRVEDTGIGIPESSLSRLFQKFQQADVSTTRQYGGTGLGLAICKQLVEAMGGEISVTSKLGVGTTFEFNIPLPLGNAPERVENEELSPHAHRLRVLCAEDYPANQLIARALLESMGHEIEIVDNGRKALDALAARRYDLVLMDSRMPEMDGLDASRAIRSGGTDRIRVLEPDVLIIALTANASTADRAACLQAGMNDYLTKPIDEQVLHQKLSWVIEQRLAHGIALPTQASPTEPAAPVAPPVTGPQPAPALIAAAPPAPAASAAPVRPLSARVQALFFDALPERLAELETAVAAFDYPTLSRQAHGLKGTVAHFGGAHVQAIAAALEEASDRADADGVLHLHPQLRDALQAMLTLRAAKE